MEQGKEFYAFISYKREDEKWAKWLQNKLEHYHFPTNLNGRTDLPKNLRPICRDVTDFTPGLLAGEIFKALCGSEWLIVICSPRSAKSPWVCKEAQTFIDLGRADHIIPFVIEGVPFSLEKTNECYPEALLNLKGSKELLAANINEIGRNAAVIKVIARMFNLRFNSLLNRYEQERKKKRNICFLAFSILVTLCLFMYLHMRPVSVYYSDFVNKNGKPEGIGLIKKSIVREKSESYQFVFKRKKIGEKERRLHRVVRINSKGDPTMAINRHEFIIGSLKNEYPIIEITEFGIQFFDIHNNRRENWEYSTINTPDDQLLIADIKRFSIGEDNKTDYSIIKDRQYRANINRICYELDEGGYPSKITYHNGSSGNLDESMCDNDFGAYGYIIQRDSINRIVSLFVLNSNGHLDTDKYYVHNIKYTYADNGIHTISTYDLEEKPITSEILRGVHKVVGINDEYGNPIENTYYDINLQPCNSNNGFYLTKNAYDNGHIVESSYYDTTGKRVNNLIDMSSKLCYYYDSKGRCIRIEYYDTEDNLYPNIDGYAEVEYKYNSRGDLISTWYYDNYHKPTISKRQGYATLLHEVNSLGQVINASCFGINGEKIINKEGFHAQKVMYNRFGQVCRYELYDLNGNLITGKDGWAIREQNSSTARNGKTFYTISFFGSDKEGVCDDLTLSHKIVFTYNDLGQCMEENYYNVNGALCLNRFGYAKCIYTYDKRGRLSTRNFYDTKNERTILYNTIDYSKQLDVVGGFAKDSIAYVSNKKHIVYRFNCDGEIDDCVFCSAVESNEFKKDTIITTLYDKYFNKVVNEKAGYAIRVAVFDAFRQPIECLYFDADSVRLQNNGVSRMLNDFDDRRNRIEVKFLDSNNSLICYLGTGAILRTEYDNRNNEIRKYWLNENLEPLMDDLKGFGFECKYDNFDRVIEKTSIDTRNGAFVMPDVKYSTQRFEYDDFGNILKESYYNGNIPVNCSAGFHAMEYKYNKAHQAVQLKYYSADGLPVSVNGVHCINRIYDGLQIKEEQFYDENRILIRTSKYYYDEVGNLDYAFVNYTQSFNSQKEYVRIAIYENDNSEAFVILKWEQWDVSQPINNYLNYLIQKGVFMQTQAKVLVYNVMENSLEYKTIDYSTNIDRISIPDYVYDDLVEINSDRVDIS